MVEISTVPTIANLWMKTVKIVERNGIFPLLAGVHIIKVQKVMQKETLCHSRPQCTFWLATGKSIDAEDYLQILPFMM